MQEDFSIREIELKPLSEYENFFEWKRQLEYIKGNIEKNQFLVEPSLRTLCPYATCPVLPG